MLDGWSLPKVLLSALTGAVLLTLVIGAGTSSASLGVFNTDWDGVSEIRGAAEAAGAETTVARNVSEYSAVPANETLAVVLSPDESYGNDSAAVRAYVRSGGTLVVAEDYGSGGNELLSAIGAEARVDGRSLRDERRAGPSPAFPKARVNGSHPLSGGTETLVLNHGSVIEPGNATTLANSSSFSYLDGNGNEALDDTETLAARPVATVERVGAGRVIAISDPSIFLNSMVDRGDNGAFLTALASKHEHVLVDVSHASGIPPLVAARLSLQDSPVGIVLGGVLSIAVVLVLATGWPSMARFRSEPVSGATAPSKADILTTLRSRHPDWDEDRVRRVTDSLIHTDDNERTDG